MRELSRTDQDATTIASRGLRIPAFFTVICILNLIYLLAAVYLGIAEEALGSRLESLEQLFDQAQEVH